ncbi:type II secretion system protein GspN [Halobacteriovorax marinus]|mgnify:CR=1 FL=1|uniref:Type II secretion system protein GspN n=1 Tax=Halobacteriovorax marinus TaxID=97084 RepID=A0A1Y5FEI3_9BACT|nr:type II secretion system protein GspN [Halobacteriovorax marinus]
MVKLKVQPNELPDEIYSQKKMFFSKVIIGALALFFLAFCFNFPLDNIIKSHVAKALSSNRACPITYDELKFEWFFPKIIIKKPVVSGICFNNPAASLKLKDLIVKVQSPSFWPLGVKLHAKIKHKFSVLNIYPTIGLTSHAVKIEKSSISHDTLVKVLGSKSLKFTGDIEIESVLKFKGNNIISGDLFVNSQNLNIPPQNLGGFDLPNLPISVIQIKASINAKNLLDIQDIRIGNADAPILAEIDGKIKLNPHNIRNSALDLNGDIKFSPEFLENFGILNMLLGGKKPSDKGFYKFNLKGKLSAPRPSFQ